MRSRAMRVTLTLLAVVAIGAGAYFSWTNHARFSASVERAEVFNSARIAATRRAFELRSSQQAYVAAGQNEQFWFERVTAETVALRAALPALKTMTTAPAAQIALDEATVGLQEFDERDRRVRSYASSGQRLLASDIIFSDGLEATSRIISALDEAGAAAAQAQAGATADAIRGQLVAGGAAAGVAILTLLLLTPVRRDTVADASVTAAGVIQETAPLALGGGQGTPSLRLAEVQSTSTARLDTMRLPAEMVGLDLRRTISTDDSLPVVAPAHGASAPSVPAAQIELQSIAGVCIDLARLADTSRMPDILERTAAALDASGLVLWVADADGKQLLPMAAYGYPASVLSRMGALPADAENATSAAYRTGLLQTVSADATSKGAIAAPLVSPSGCLGVMSAEVRHDGERHPARLAAASIVAAQLATIVGPPAARTEDRNTAAL